MTLSTRYQTIEFFSGDGLAVTADYYPAERATGCIVLCHGSHGNRAQYRETAPRFCTMGFSCLAIDQRAGMRALSEENLTKKRATEQGLSTSYLDALQDIEAAVDYAYALNKRQPVILLGSSYSASLVLLLATRNDKLEAVIAFSPGEYLKGVNLSDELESLTTLTYVTSAKDEIPELRALTMRADQRLVTHFEPVEEGIHGSKTLWKEVKGHEAHWQSLKRFLRSLQEKRR